MKLKTTIPITIEAARQFEDEQGLKGIKKRNIFRQEDCFWELEVTERKMGNGFTAKVEWFQLQEYDRGDGDIEIRPMIMYSEDFRLSVEDLDTMFDQLGISITPNQDSLAEKFDQIVLAGIIYWVGTTRQIFGLDGSGFEVVVAARPAVEDEVEVEVEIEKQ